MAEAKFLLFHKYLLKKVPSPCLSSLSLKQFGSLVRVIVLCVLFPHKAEISHLISEQYTEHVFRTSMKFGYQNIFERT